MDKNGRIDLHTHSFFSDGVLLPSEMLRRAEALGYAALAITDHADVSNLDEIAAQLVRFSRAGLAGFSLHFVPGVEITDVPPEQIAPLARRAKRLGVRLVAARVDLAADAVKALADEVELRAQPAVVVLVR